MVCTRTSSFCAILTANETETSSLKNELKEVSSQLEDHEKLFQEKSIELEQMEASLREKRASLSGMLVKCTCISYSTIQCIIYGRSWSD